MEDEDSLSRAFSVLALAARSCPSGDEILGAAASSLPEETLIELHDVFGTIGKSRGNYCSSQRLKDSMWNPECSNAASQSSVDYGAEMWEELARQGISVASAIQGLIGSMESGGKPGLMSADVYLGFMLAPGCPLYSLFSQIAFNSLLRCMRHACKPAAMPEQEGSAFGAGTVKTKGKGRGGKRKGKNGSDKSLGSQESGYDEEIFLPEAQNNHTVSPQAALDDVLQLLKRLQMTLRVFHFKDHQESLRSLIEFLIELPHLVSEMQIEDAGGESRAKRTAQHHASSPLLTTCSLCLDILKNLLDPSHGNPMDTAVVSFKLLAPGILLIRAGGNPYQRGQIREQTLSFITSQLKRHPHPGLRSVIAALPRYLAMKAPEKTEPRALAVESVLAIVKILAIPDQRKFGHFVTKLSRGKPRHRLFAVDLAQALLGMLPDPLGLDKDEDCPNDEHILEEENAPMEEEIVQVEDGSKGLDEVRNTVRTPSPGACGSSDAKIWWGTACLEALLHRCSDKLPAIRARALNNLAQVLEQLSSDIQNRAVLQSLLGFGTMPPPSNKEAEYSLRKAALLNDWHTPGHSSPNLGGQTPSPEPSLVGPGASPLTPGAGHGDLGSLLRRRCFDDKVAVRKATLLLMTKSASLLGRPPDETMLEAMGSACADPMVSIRKAAMGALSEVMRKFPADTKVVGEWYQSVLPLVLDNESSIHEECLSLFEELVVDRVAAVASSKFLGGGKLNPLHMDGTILKLSSEQELERRMPPGILVVLKGMADDSAVAACIKRVVTCLGKKKRVRAGVALALQNIITSSRALWCSRNKEGTSSRTCWTAPAGAWLLLAEVSAFVPKAVGWEFLRTHWQLLEREESMPVQGGLPSGKKVSSVIHFADWAADRVHLLQTISNVAVELPPNAAADLASELLERLEGFSMDPTEVGAHVKALHVLCIQKAASADEGDRLVTTWVEELLEKAGQVVTSYLSVCTNSEPTEIHTSLHTSKSGGSNNDSAESCQRDDNSGQSTLTGVKTSSQIIPAIFTMGALVLICPKLKFGNLPTLVQAIITSRKAGLKLHNQNDSCEDLARGVVAQAWVTLGKMCLANHELAKRCIPLFLQEFEQSESAPVRNNIMIAMSDFCVRYTSLIDGYIHKLTKSLRDSCELVRRQGFVLLAQLLQRDYVKWRGTLFHRFLLALVDDSEKIRQLANFLFSSILKTKAPLLAYNSFVETIFVLNDCHAHAGHIDILHVTESERELFSLRGNTESNFEMRMHIYKCLLKQMAPEHVLATSAKLCADILAAAADGMLNLEDPTAQCVLEDSLKILASKEMRIGGNRGAAAAENFEGEEDGAAAFAAVKGRVVSQLAKRNLVQNAIPIFIELKRLLESKNSPLTGMLMECMRVMLKEYKNEIEEILVADKQLQKEIMYDMQKHEAAKAKAKVVAAATAVLSPGSAGLCQRDGNAVVPPRSISKKTPSAEKGRRVADGKENMAALKGKSIVDGQSLEQGPAKASTGLLSKRKTFLSPESSSRVRWLDQTPDLSSQAAHISGSSSRGGAPGVGISTPVNGLRPAYDGQTSNAPMEGDFADRLQSNMASAVANVVAEATAAAVLSEVARGTPTGPLQAMSIPRLQATVPSTVKKATFLSSCEAQEDVPANGLLSQEDETLASLESVRRRQSFSSIDVPGSSS